MNQIDEAQVQQVQKEISELLGGIIHEIPIILFAQPGVNDVYSDAARQTLRFFRQLTDKIVVREFNLDHEFAQKWNVQYSPTLV